MKAVNLIPRESRSNRALSTSSFGAGHAIIGVLLVAIAFAAVYVLTENKISDRKAQLAALNSEVAQTQSLASSLQQYISYSQSAQQQANTVRAIVAARFDWDTALTELSRVVPSNTALQSLYGTVVPGATVNAATGAGGSAGTGPLRADIAVPAFEIRGCTASQDEVANLMSRLRLINGVTRVTLADSQKDNGSTGVCSPSSPSFDIVVFFTEVPNAGTEGVTSTAGGATVPIAASTSASTQATSQPTGNTGNGG